MLGIFLPEVLSNCHDPLESAAQTTRCSSLFPFPVSIQTSSVTLVIFSSHNLSINPQFLIQAAMHTSAHTAVPSGRAPSVHPHPVVVSPSTVFTTWKELFALKFLSMSEQVFFWSFMTVMQKRTIPIMHRKNTNILPYRQPESVNEELYIQAENWATEFL